MKPLLLVVVLLGLGVAPLLGATGLGAQRQEFKLDGHACFVGKPAIAAPGKPWVWRTSFPDYHAEVDTELLRNGWHVAYIDCVDMLGCDAALDAYDKFYAHVRREFGLSACPALEGVSRGGLHAYRYAARHPQRIACIYADTPVLDLKSWPKPGGKEFTDALKFYGLKDAAALRAFRGNPLDLLATIAQAKIPLRHVISMNDTIVPPEQNTLEAQRRLAALQHSMEVVRVTTGTAASNGHHFALSEVFASAQFIMRHSYVLPAEGAPEAAENSAPQGISAQPESFLLRAGLNNSRAAFEQTKKGRVVFLGGSITFGSGWREATMSWLQQRFSETIFDFVAAGVPSLGSVPHAFRLERDVLARGPVDLLFVEAAVNDHNHDGHPAAAALALRGMEGVVHHLRTANALTDVVALHFVHDQHLNTYLTGKRPIPLTQHERVAEHYACASLDLSREVYDRIQSKQFTWADDFRDLHPSPYGQLVYSNSIARLLDAAYRMAPAPAAAHVVPPQLLDANSYSRGRFGVLEKAECSKGMQRVARWTPAIPSGTREGFVNVPALVGTVPGAAFEFEFDGTAAGLMIGAGPDTGILEVRVDQGTPFSVDTFTPWSTSLYLPWAVMLADDLAPGHHIVRIQVSAKHHPSSKGTALHVFQLLLN